MGIRSVRVIPEKGRFLILAVRNYLGKMASFLIGVLSVTGMLLSSANGKDLSLGIAGKNDWLFYQYEMLDPSEEVATAVSVDLISRLNKVLAKNGVTLIVAIVPIKMRIYAEYLPDDRKLSAYMTEHYERVLTAMRAGIVDASDLNGTFLKYTKRNSEDPVFFLRDTHWNPTGALLAAEAIKLDIKNSPQLTAALEAVPEVDFRIAIGNLKRPFKGGDLIGQLPKRLTTLAPEQVKPVSVIRADAETDGVTSNRPSAGLALVGSTYSYEWTGFLDALRYTLQRDVLGVPYSPGEGPWQGLENYFRSAHFQSNRTKLLIWEIPERELRGPPSYRFRDPRFISDNEDWLLRVSALAQRNCQPTDSSATIERVGLAARAVEFGGNNITTGATKDKEFIQIVLDKPLGASNYLSARYTALGSKSITVESLGSGSTVLNSMIIRGGEVEHSLKIPIITSGKSVTRVKIYPGTGRALKLHNLQVCQ